MQRILYKALVVVGIVLNVTAFAVVVRVFGDGINDFTLNIFDLSENYFTVYQNTLTNRRIEVCNRDKWLK